jgi:uncharacterized membrane protein
MESQTPTPTDATPVNVTLASESAPESATAESAAPASATPGAAAAPPTATNERPPSYVKLAMRNMVRKKGLSIFHFTLTTLGLLGFLVGVSYLTR